MNGAIAEPSDKTIIEPSKKSKIIRGSKYHFFRTFINSQTSNIFVFVFIVFQNLNQ